MADLLDAAFVPAVMGIARGDVTELKLFIAAARTGYNLRFAVDALGEEMRTLKNPSAGRPLSTEEEALRRLWITLVYLTLEELTGNAIGTDGSEALVPSSIRSEQASLVANLLEAKRTGKSLGELDVEALAGSSAAPRGAMEMAVLQQSLRIVYLTVEVVDAVEQAGERADAPQPFIPGTQQ